MSCCDSCKGHLNVVGQGVQHILLELFCMHSDALVRRVLTKYWQTGWPSRCNRLAFVLTQVRRAVHLSALIHLNDTYTQDHELQHSQNVVFVKARDAGCTPPSSQTDTTIQRSPAGSERHLVVSAAQRQRD